jgi:hypothetical protein
MNMVDLKRLKIVETKHRILCEELSKVAEELDFLRRSHYRDMKDQWSSGVVHPVTGGYKPNDTLLFEVFYYDE